MTSLLVNLLPVSLKGDPFTIALAEAVEKELKEAYEEAESMSNFSKVDQLPEELLDYLGYQRNVDFYDKGLDIEKKRELIRKAKFFQRYKGTAAAVEEMVETVFPKGKVQEWFEYGGDPFKFKVSTTDRVTDPSKIPQIFKAIETVKNKRSKLESLTIERDKDMNSYIGVASSQSSIVQINPFFMPKEQDSKENIFVSNFCTQTNIITIYPEVK
jgi:phage tail P2-like protein